jgi:pantoate--beta-alanine ligase
MKIIKTVKEMQAHSQDLRKQGKSIGFVPTMGFLHEGHLSLVKKCKEQCDVTAASIFVNPLQFSPQEDFEDYPRDFERDKKLLEELGVEVIFYPNAEEMYNGELTFVEVKKLSHGLCGESRPTHFRGVTTVVAKLFNAVLPDYAFFGEKDFQQLKVIEKMTQDLNLPVQIVACQTVREEDDIAMSSRNTYLSEEERKQACVLFESLQLARKLYSQGETNAENILEEMKKLIASKPLAKLDYVAIVNSETLEPVEKVSDKDRVLLAVFFGKTRLIDNAGLK